MPNPRTRAGGDPLGAAYARVTYRLEWRLCTLCQIMTQKAAAEILRMPTSTLQSAAPGQGHGHKIRGRVDEISFCKGRKFATLVYDLTGRGSCGSAQEGP